MTTATATLTEVELFAAQPETPRAAGALRALERAAGAAGVQITRSRQYLGRSPWLLVWGPGAPIRAEAIRHQVAAGGHAIALDLAYWNRSRKVRVSIDAPHPQAWLQQPRTAERFDADPAPVASRHDPAGPVVVAGIGQKATVQYGADQVTAWEQAMAAACVARGQHVVYRPKPGRPVPEGLSAVSATVPIEAVLEGASLLITWHSNAAIDAIRLGIPVVCRDGAAAAVYGATLPTDPRGLSLADRLAFLARLAWFQWDLETEAAACWSWLREVLA